MLTPSERRLRARLAALSQHAQGRTNTAAASAAFLSRFEAEVDPTGSLPPEERARRAKLALRAHMARLALISARKRRRGPIPELVDTVEAVLEAFEEEAAK